MHTKHSVQPVKQLLALATLLLVGACVRTQPMPETAPAAFVLPDSTTLIDGATGNAVPTAELLRRVAASDIVLLGEVHDNPVAMSARAALIDRFAARRPAFVFEQIPETDSALAPPAPGDSLEGWLDRVGFDRQGWRWPMHRPVVEAALAHGRGIWGSGLSREALRTVVMNGDSGAPAPLRDLMMRAPLDSNVRAVLDRDLVTGHCGQLPESMIPGMRSAQVVRDASMTRALTLASAGGPVWLIAGNGHVRSIGVPRILRVTAPGKSLLVIGLLEREPTGIDAAERQMYDLVITIPKATREDPCRALRNG